jgi:hypothetical protein
MASWEMRSLTARRGVKGNSAILREKARSPCRRPRCFSAGKGSILTLGRTPMQLDERRAKKKFGTRTQRRLLDRRHRSRGVR